MLKKQFDLNIDINNEGKAKVVNSLAILLANTSVLYMKTLNYHWNVSGPFFNNLHQLTNTQYNELALAVDEIAERIRKLGFYAPATYSEYLKLSKITESTVILDFDQMIKDLVSSHEIVTKIIRDIFPLAEEIKDQVTLDLLTRRLEFHESNLWILKVSIPS